MGCNYQSKNSTDMNYLHVAEHKYNADILVEHKANKFVPLDKDGNESNDATGEFGCKVYITDLKDFSSKVFVCDKLILAAGTFPTNELLLRARDEFKTMPRISRRLGEGVFGQWRLSFFCRRIPRACRPQLWPCDHTKGLTIIYLRTLIATKPLFLKMRLTQLYSLGLQRERNHFFLKNFGVQRPHSFLLATPWGHKNLSKVTVLLNRFLRHDISWNTSIHLYMGYDKSDGTIKLDENKRIDLHWPQEKSMSLYKAILKSVDDFKGQVKAKFWFQLPTWHLKRNVTVHPLGGATLSRNSDEGVMKVQR